MPTPPVTRDGLRVVRDRMREAPSDPAGEAAPEGRAGIGEGAPGGRANRNPDRVGGPAEAVRIRRAVTLLLMSVVVPGSAQFVAGNRRLGRFLLRAWLVLIGLGVLLGLLWLVARSFVLWLVTAPAVLTFVGLVCFGWALAAAGLLVHAWLLGRPQTLPRRARQWLAGLGVVLLLVAAWPPVAAGRRAWAAADLIGSVFTGTKTSAAVDGRFNVLLLGGDAGPDRIGTRPDSVTLASIDANTGRTVLFSLPRNLENVPFPDGSPGAKAWPHGWSCGDACLLNAIYTWASEHPSLFPGVADPGAEAMKEAAQAITGLTVNYYVLIDLAGFERLIDAMGGITVNVKTPVPIGGGTTKVSGYVQPGIRKLDGYHALWFARSRHGASDYDRMARQRCVMDAMLRQLEPQAVLANFQEIAAASSRVVSTDLPAGQLSTFLDLAVKAKGQSVRSVQFVPPLINPAHPDFGVVRDRVTRAIGASEHGDAAAGASPAPAVTPSGAPRGTAPATAKSRATGRATPSVGAGTPAGAAVPVGGDDVSSICSAA